MKRLTTLLVLLSLSLLVLPGATHDHRTFGRHPSKSETTTCCCASGTTWMWRHGDVSH